MKTTELLDLFHEDYKEIISEGRKAKVPEKDIEALQEKYVSFIIRMVLRISGMPIEKKKELLKLVENKLFSDSAKTKKHKLSDTLRLINSKINLAKKPL